MKSIKGCFRSSVGKEQNRFLSPVWARWEEHQRVLIFLEQKCQELCQTVEHIEQDARIVGHPDGKQEAFVKRRPLTNFRGKSLKS